LNISNPFFVAGVLKPGGSVYTYTATAFDSGDYLGHSGSLTSAADSKLMTVSFWLKLNDAAQNGTVRKLYSYLGDQSRIWLETDDTLRFSFEDNGGANFVARYISTATFTQSASWRHVAIAFNVTGGGTSLRWVYVDGASDGGTWTFWNDFAIDWDSGGDHGIMARSSGTEIVTGSLAEFYLSTAHAVNLSTSLTLFRTAGGKPENLGADGSTPTGSQPIIYLKNPFGTFQNNLGSGGNFTVTGTLADDANIP
jgi:hypothetical protein